MGNTESLGVPAEEVCPVGLEAPHGALKVPVRGLDSLLQAKEKSFGACQALNHALRKNILAGAERRDCG